MIYFMINYFDVNTIIVMELIPDLSYPVGDYNSESLDRILLIEWLQDAYRDKLGFFDGPNDLASYPRPFFSGQYHSSFDHMPISNI